MGVCGEVDNESGEGDAPLEFCKALVVPDSDLYSSACLLKLDVSSRNAQMHHISLNITQRIQLSWLDCVNGGSLSMDEEEEEDDEEEAEEEEGEKKRKKNFY